MSIPKDNYTRLFQNIDQGVSSEKTGKKTQEAGVKAYDPEKMGAARRFFAKKMGIEYKTAEGKTVYLDKASLSKFLARNKAIASEKDFNPKTCIDQLKSLYMPIAAKAGAAFKDGNFRISAADLKTVCKGLGMTEQNANIFLGLLDGYRTATLSDGAEIDSKTGSLRGTKPAEYLVEKGDDSRITPELIKFLAKNCKPDPMMRSTLMTLLANLKSLSK